MIRTLVRDTLRDHLAPCESVLAMWEAGSAAFARVDDFSDLDIGLLSRNETNEEVWSLVDAAFDSLGGVALRWNELSPLFEQMDKRVFRLREASRWLQVDIGLFAETAANLHNQPERHGEIAVIFDHGNRLHLPGWDAEGHRRRMREALHQEIMKWQIYYGWFRKELARSRAVDAFAAYLGGSVRPLLSVLGMRYRPARWDFGMRYLNEDMPAEVVQTIERLCYVSEPSLLEERFAEADQLFQKTVNELKQQGIVPLDTKGIDIPLETSMPFKSQAQRRKFAQLLVEGKISNQTFEEWNRETGRKKLPERVGSKAQASRRARSSRRPPATKKR